ncbi:maltokinase N-terminal cap-like domain-containing protein [Streptomyces pharetrae]|uniref:maltokinase N-terminal cap-like domain-containing protein n=1 Tax=Streptomyces pharetrae TaxID=291370 RepID=UPI000D1BCB7A
MSAATHHGAAVDGARRPARATPRAAEPGHRRAETLLRPLLPILTPWLATRRWYQGTTMSALRPAGVTVIGGEGRPDLLVAVVETGSGTAYQLLLGIRSELPRRLEPAAIGTVPYGPWAGQRLYDAVADPALMGALLRALAGRRAGPLRLDPAGPHPLPVGLVPRPLAVDQSNSAVVYGDRLLLKLYRRPEPGPHPEVEALRALTGQDCPRTPRLHGSLHLDGLTLGLVEEFLPGAEDGWRRAVAHARDHLTASADPDTGPGPAGGFTADSQALGRAVAETHGALARAFPRVRLSAEDVAADAARMKRRLTAAVAEVPQLARHRSRLAALFDEYGRLGVRGCPVLAQRTHGDLHLGQALYTGGDWRLVDFEGEPATPAAERALPQPVLRDVAGMLRSFDYAARAALLSADPENGPAETDTGPGRQLSRLRRAGAWALRNRRAFCAGYADGGGEDPACRSAQLTAFEADRAVYEVVYEARHRPHWLPVPLAAVHRLAGGRAH